MFIPNCRRYPLAEKLTSFVLYVSMYCTVCHLSLTRIFWLNMVVCLTHEGIFVILPLQF
ncbi:hypothetical protein Hanom_Chr05g00442661 [Helianthus anomalus]